MKICPKCKHANQSGFSFCEACGTDLRGIPVSPGAVRRPVRAPAKKTSSAWAAAGWGCLFIIGFVSFLLLWLVHSVAMGSCPHVYSYDGTAYRLDADPLSGSFLQGAEREDLVRLDHAAAVDGRYRLQIRDELPEMDALDSLQLVLVDHDPALDVLPTQDGGVLGLANASPPTEARDASDIDRLDAVLAPDDGKFVAAAADPAADTANTTSLDLWFARPREEATLALALRAHATPFAEEALARYLGAMGPGLMPLMHAAENDDSYAFPQRIRDEIRRLGLLLSVETPSETTVEISGGATSTERTPATVELGPVGPAIQRTQAVLLRDLESARGERAPLHVRLHWTPRFWTIDMVRVGTVREVWPAATLEPSVAVSSDGAALALVRAADGERVTLAPGERLDLEFVEPTPVVAGQSRTALLRVRGYYETNTGKPPWINPVAIFLHRTGWDSLPRSAARLARTQPELVASGVR